MTALKNCPSCGRSVDFEEKYARIIACWYCNSILEFGTWELSKIWEQAEFIEFPSEFIVWKETEWEWKKVYVKWQLRYEYDWGFFDLFFVEIDNNMYYIQEDDWIKTIIKNWKWQKSSMKLLDINVWEKFNISWNDIFVQETGIFKIEFMKWFVNTELVPWESYEYLDWILNWKIIHIEKNIWKNMIRVNNEIDI